MKAYAGPALSSKAAWKTATNLSRTGQSYPNRPVLTYPLYGVLYVVLIPMLINIYLFNITNAQGKKENETFL